MNLTKTRRPKAETHKVAGFSLPTELLDELTEVSLNLRRTKSSVVHSALEDYFRSLAKT